MSERPNDASEATDLEPEGAPDTEAQDFEDEAFDDAKAEEEAELVAEREDEAASMAAEADVERTRGMRPSERRALRTTGQAQIQIDPSLRIKDRASAVFVLVAVGVFALILLNGLVLGHGGFFAPLPTPTPTPILTPGPSPTAAPSGSPAASGSPSASGSPAASGSASPSATPEVTPAPTPTADAS
jgi:hypothetical protein